MKYKMIKKMIGIYMWILKNKRVYQYCNKVYFAGAGYEHFKKAVHLCRQYIDKNDVIIDAGASFGNEGDSTPFFAMAFPKNRVFAFEPMNDVFQILLKNTEKIQNVKCVKKALFSYIGKQNIQVTNNSGSSSLFEIDGYESKAEKVEETMNIVRTEEVEVTTIDDFCEMECPDSQIALFKLDVQGSELEILKGAGKFLDRTKVILVEMPNNYIYKSGCQYYEIDEFLRQHDFVLFYNICDNTDYNKHIQWDSIYISKKLIK